MKTQDELLSEIGRVMGATGLKRQEMIQAIASKNNVKIRTIYLWIENPDPMNYGRIEGALESIVADMKGAKS